MKYLTNIKKYLLFILIIFLGFSCGNDSDEKNNKVEQNVENGNIETSHTPGGSVTRKAKGGVASGVTPENSQLSSSAKDGFKN